MLLSQQVSSASLFLLLLAQGPVAVPQQAPVVDWSPWQNFAVMNGGRFKPIATVGRDVLLAVSGNAEVTNSDSGQQLSPSDWYMTMLFEWSGWDHARVNELLTSNDAVDQYSYLHRPDRWDKTPLLRVEHSGLKQLLGLPEHVKFVSPAVLATTNVVDFRSHKSIPFTTWGRLLLELKEAGKSLDASETDGLELARRLQCYRKARMGLDIELPIDDEYSTKRLTLGELMVANFDDVTDKSGKRRRAQSLLRDIRSAFLSGDAAIFNAKSQEFSLAISNDGITNAPRPRPFVIDVEAAYSRVNILGYVPGGLLVAALTMALHAVFPWKSLWWCGIGAYALGFIAILVDIILRSIISDRPPVTNMYESMLYVSIGTAALGAGFAFCLRQRHIAIGAALFSASLCLIANGYPTVFDSSIRPLAPVLRNNLWLILHVMTITLSYAAFAVAAAAGNLSLGYMAFGTNQSRATTVLETITCTAIEIGVVLLTCGMVAGAIWADHAWGSFWRWDPKEVWSLAALLIYSAVIYASRTGSLSSRTLAVLIIMCFLFVIVGWVGTNSALGTSMHNYATSHGSGNIVLATILGQLIYVMTALHRARSNEHRHGSSDLSFAGINAR